MSQFLNISTFDINDVKLKHLPGIQVNKANYYREGNSYLPHGFHPFDWDFFHMATGNSRAKWLREMNPKWWTFQLAMAMATWYYFLLLGEVVFLCFIAFTCQKISWWLYVKWWTFQLAMAMATWYYFLLLGEVVFLCFIAFTCQKISWWLYVDYYCYRLLLLWSSICESYATSLQYVIFKA